MVLFCQMDVTGRTEADPAAERLARNIIGYVGWLEAGRRSGRRSTSAIRPARPTWRRPACRSLPTRAASSSPEQVLIVGPGGAPQLAARPRPSWTWLKAGGHLLAIGLDQAGRRARLSANVTMKKARAHRRLLRAVRLGLAPGRHRAGRRPQPRSAGVPSYHGRGHGRRRRSLATTDSANVVFCQLVPWKFDYSKRSTTSSRRSAAPPSC